LSNSDDLDSCRDLSIDDAVGKFSQDVSLRACLEDRPKVRRVRDQRECVLQLSNKCLRRLEASFEVPLKGIVDL